MTKGKPAAEGTSKKLNFRRMSFGHIKSKIKEVGENIQNSARKSHLGKGDDDPKQPENGKQQNKGSKDQRKPPMAKKPPKKFETPAKKAPAVSNESSSIDENMENLLQEKAIIDPNVIKIQYLERENKNLQNAVELLQSQKTNIQRNMNELIENQPDASIQTIQASNLEDMEQLKSRIKFLEKERDELNAKLLIGNQYMHENTQTIKDLTDTFNQEIDELKEAVDRKELLLQQKEEKYYQYEKVLRDLILNRSTPEPVKDQLREKIENQELFVPKDEWKLSNVVLANKELGQQVSVLKEENTKMRT